MRRTITGFHGDDAGDWVAELSCLHGQHVRHRPPFQDRAWVLQQAGRDERIGADLDCPLCDRAEPPGDLVIVRTAGPFDAQSLPPGLRRAHRVAAGTWGRVRVTGGAVHFTMGVEPQVNERLAAGAARWLPPEVSHALAVEGPVSLEIDFFTRASPPRP